VTASTELDSARWGAQAACLTADPDGFDPTTAAPGSIRYPRERRVRASAARRFCAGCPVIAPCGLQADARTTEGVFGGSLRSAAILGGRPAYLVDPLIPGAPASTHRKTRRVKPAGAA